MEINKYFIMNKRVIVFLIAFTLPLCMFGQPITSNDCNKIKCGTFYFYPINAQSGFVVIRKNSMQEEINLETSDTSFWEVNWKNTCEFNLKFIRKNQPMSDEEKTFYSSHISVFKVLKVTKKYYVFNAGLDSLNSANALTDTLWFKPRLN